jgi:hypothetical protein
MEQSPSWEVGNHSANQEIPPPFMSPGGLSPCSLEPTAGTYYGAVNPVQSLHGVWWKFCVYFVSCSPTVITDKVYSIILHVVFFKFSFLHPNILFRTLFSFKGFLSYLHTKNCQLSSIQASRILIQVAEISKKIYYFYKDTQKQIDTHMFANYMAVLPAITLESSWSCDHITINIYQTSFTH